MAKKYTKAEAAKRFGLDPAKLPAPKAKAKAKAKDLTDV